MERGHARVIGRESELAAVDDLLTATRSGFAVLTLEGEPGIGKTMVWREALERAAARGYRVLSARPTEAEATLSLVGLGDLFATLDRAVIERLPPPQRDALAAALLQAPAPGHGIDERALTAAALSLLRLLSAECPLLLAVDDAQWLDTQSSRVLSFAVRRLQAEPIACMTTVRIGAGHVTTFDRAADRAVARVMRLGPLSVAALHEMIKRRTGRSLPRPAIVHLAQVCGGNPLFAIEAAQELGGRAPASGRMVVPASLGDLLGSKLRRLPASTRRALLVTSLLSRPTTELAGREALEPAERAGIVVTDSGHVAFTHPMFASVVQAEAAAPALRGVHRELAAAVDEPEERARHAALGADTPNTSIAVDLEVAANLARSRGAPAAAAELLELAITMAPADDQARQDGDRVAAAAAWFDAGDLARAEALLTEATRARVQPRTRARALHLLSQLHARRSTFGEALAVACAALQTAAGDDGLTADLEMDVAYYAISLGDVPMSLEHVAAAVRAAERAGSAGLLADAMATSVVCEFVAGMGFDEARILRARELEDPWRPRAWQIRPAFIHGNLLLYVGRAAEACGVLGALHAEAIERGEESPIPFSCFWLAWACLWSGDFPGARRRADEARRTAPLLDDPAASAMALVTAALVHAHDGSVDLAREEATDALRRFQELGWMVGVMFALWALGLAELSAGRPAAVDAALGPLAGQVTAMPACDPFMAVFLPIAVEALVELGQIDTAEPLLRWFEGRATALERPWAQAAASRCRGLICAAGGDSDGAAAAMVEALRHDERSPVTFERGRTLLAAGQVHRRRKEKRLAAERLGEALHIFRDLGAAGFASRAEAELARLGLRPPTADALTQTERRVAELAATGLSNREIAHRSFLTTKAVEGNLTRVYRKLGIRSRGGLARALQSAEGTAAREDATPAP